MTEAEELVLVALASSVNVVVPPPETTMEQVGHDETDILSPLRNWFSTEELTVSTALPKVVEPVVEKGCHANGVSDAPTVCVGPNKGPYVVPLVCVKTPAKVVQTSPLMGDEGGEPDGMLIEADAVVEGWTPRVVPAGSGCPMTGRELAANAGTAFIAKARARIHFIIDLSRKNDRGCSESNESRTDRKLGASINLRLPIARVRQA